MSFDIKSLINEAILGSVYGGFDEYGYNLDFYSKANLDKQLSNMEFKVKFSADAEEMFDEEGNPIDVDTEAVYVMKLIEGKSFNLRLKTQTVVGEDGKLISLPLSYNSTLISVSSDLFDAAKDLIVYNMDNIVDDHFINLVINKTKNYIWNYYITKLSKEVIILPSNS